MTAEQENMLAQKLSVVLELTATDMGPEAKFMIVKWLSKFKFEAAVKALHAAADRCKGRLTLALIKSCIDTDRPSAEQAWSMIIPGENATFLWTEDMQRAYGVAAHMRMAGDEVGARLAFKAEYEKVVLEAVEAGKPVKWAASLGWDKNLRYEVLEQGAREGKLPVPYVNHFLPAERQLTEQGDRAMTAKDDWLQ